MPSFMLRHGRIAVSANIAALKSRCNVADTPNRLSHQIGLTRGEGRWTRAASLYHNALNAKEKIPWEREIIPGC